ncbi:MAG: hypothetical protein JNL83_03015, partial [Myxococcales bacterium]|nr:hypothetical protein [Myxococcales bacterium]
MAATTASPARVSVIAPDRLGATAIAALRARGIEAAAAAVADPADVVAWALESVPTGAAVIELAQACARAADA